MLRTSRLGFALALALSGCAVLEGAASMVGLGATPPAAENTTPSLEELTPAQAATLDAAPAFAWDLEAMGRACGYDKRCQSEQTLQFAGCKEQKQRGLPRHEHAGYEVTKRCQREFESRQAELRAIIDRYARAKKAEDEAAERAAQEAQTEMPAARQRDPRIEKSVAEHFENVLKVVLTSDWVMVRADSGVLTGRVIRASVAYRDQDGCRRFVGDFVQEHDGSTFSGPLRRRVHGNERWIACTRVK